MKYLKPIHQEIYGTVTALILLAIAAACSHCYSMTFIYFNGVM